MLIASVPRLLCPSSTCCNFIDLDSLKLETCNERNTRQANIKRTENNLEYLTHQNITFKVQQIQSNPMDINLQKKRFHIFIFIIALIGLSIVAEKCRHLVGEEASSKSGQFTLLNCFDMGTGTLACTVKEGVKLYVNTFQSFHVDVARNRAMETTLTDAVTQGLHPKDAAKQAAKEAKKAAKLASRKMRRVTGPIISSGWDFFEAIYFGGTITEGFLRGTGTLIGTYSIGYLGEQRLGRFGYLVGSQLGSWIGGRIGLMVYDVVNGVHFLLQFTGSENTIIYESQETVYESPETVYESQNEWSESPEVYEVYEPQEEL